MSDKQLNVGEELITRLKNLNDNIDSILEKDIRTRLERLIKSEFIDSWLNTPNNAFEDKKPIELIRTKEIDKLYKMLYILESGEPLS